MENMRAPRLWVRGRLGGGGDVQKERNLEVEEAIIVF